MGKFLNPLLYNIQLYGMCYTHAHTHAQIQWNTLMWINGYTNKTVVRMKLRILWWNTPFISKNSHSYMNQLASSYEYLYQHFLLAGLKYVKRECKFKFAYDSLVIFFKTLMILAPRRQSLSLSAKSLLLVAYGWLQKPVSLWVLLSFFLNPDKSGAYTNTKSRLDSKKEAQTMTGYM